MYNDGRAAVPEKSLKNKLKMNKKHKKKQFVCWKRINDYERPETNTNQRIKGKT